MDQPKSIHFAVIGEPLNKLLIAIGNKLSREWPLNYQNVTGARELFVLHLRVAHMTYRSALYIGGDVPDDPRRLPVFCVSLAVLNRAILNSLFTLLFILDDLPNRCAWFRESDWKECRLEWIGISQSTAISQNGRHISQICRRYAIWGCPSQGYRLLKQLIPRRFDHGRIRARW